MKLLIAAALVLMLSSQAMAATETQQLGPYMVSFDMNTDIPYQVQVMEPVVTESVTTYSLVIASDNETGASINIAAFENQTDSTLYMQKSIAGLRMALYGLNATVGDRMIDGKNGYLVTGAGNTENSEIKVFEASYWLDSIDCECGPVSVGKTSVGIRSSYAQDVTESILNSLSIVSGQMATTPAAPLDMPPSDMPVT